MQLSDILSAALVFTNVEAKSKKQVLQQASNILAEACKLNAQEVFERIIERERLGSTAVGRGVAIPHTRMDVLDKPHGAFFKLKEPVDFGALDGQPVSFIFMLLAPESSGTDHLKALSIVSRTLRNREFCDIIDNIPNAKQLYDALIEESQK